MSSRVRVVLFVVCSHGLSGCASPSVPPASPDVELPPQEAATKPSAPARMMENVTPITTPLASGDGWECEDKSYTEPLLAFTSKCVRADAEIFLLAKVYEVPPEQVAPAKMLVEEIYPRNYAKMFDSFKIKRTQPARIGKHEGVDVELDAVNAKGPLRMHERVVVQGARVFILTEMGSPSAFDAFQAVRSRWFSETKFRDLAN